MVSPQAKREAVSLLMTERDFGVTRACGLLQISRALYRYRSRRAGCAGLGERIAEIAATKRRYGYRRIYIRLRREGWAVNRKHVYRLYREAGLPCAEGSASVSGWSSANPCPSR
jgi:putative transposase